MCSARQLGRTDMSELRSRVGLSSSALSQRVPDDEVVRDLVVSAGYAVLGRWREKYEDVDYEQAVDMLESLGAEHLAERTYGTLSEGERKRVLIARSLMTDPELLLLDEPAAGLDLGGREELVARLADLAADPDAPAIVLVTHHVEEIPQGFSHCLLLSEGKAVGVGPADRRADRRRTCPRPSASPSRSRSSTGATSRAEPEPARPTGDALDVLPGLKSGDSTPIPSTYAAGVELRFTVRRPPTGEVSPCCHRPSGGDVACSVDVGVASPGIAGLALEDRLALAVSRCDVPARRATLRRIRSRNLLDPTVRLVLQSRGEMSPTTSTDCPVEPALLSDAHAGFLKGAARGPGHRPHVKGFDPDHFEPPREVSGGRFHPVFTPVPLAGFQPRDRLFRPGAPMEPGLAARAAVATPSTASTHPR